ncbi:hypothetical protein OG21DRAFT_896800 [Imleria badia]|nr:hypothetical protein OG21DRAFT_896800 [Imleria badia]
MGRHQDARISTYLHKYCMSTLHTGYGRVNHAVRHFRIIRLTHPHTNFIPAERGRGRHVHQGKQYPSSTTTLHPASASEELYTDDRQGTRRRCCDTLECQPLRSCIPPGRAQDPRIRTARRRVEPTKRTMFHQTKATRQSKSSADTRVIQTSLWSPRPTEGRDEHAESIERQRAGRTRTPTRRVDQPSNADIPNAPPEPH